MRIVIILLISLLGASCAPEACPAYQMTYAQSAKRYKAPRYKTNRRLVRQDGHTRIKIHSKKSSLTQSKKGTKTKKQILAEQE